MPAFRFRLAPLLRLRELARDERRRQLAEALEIEQALTEQSRQIEQQLTENRLQQSAVPGRVNVDRLLDAQRFEMVLRVQQYNVQQQLAAITTEVARRREMLVEADREVKMLEKLRDQQQARFRADELRSENRFLDEVAMRGTAREESV